MLQFVIRTETLLSSFRETLVGCAVPWLRRKVHGKAIDRTENHLPKMRAAGVRTFWSTAGITIAGRPMVGQHAAF
jgi:hypothetical protein